jgi:predicted enzyme related to lactoylglutathione lyase
VNAVRSLASLSVFCFLVFPPDGLAKVELVGVKIRVPDMAEARSFYSDVLGFQVEKESTDKKTIWLKTNSYKIVLERSKDARRITTPGYSDVSMSMRVNDIDQTFSYLKSKGVRFIKDEKRKEGVGWSLQILDPFGNKISMMQITVGKPETIVEPSVYNCGIYVTDIETALKTYEGALGFVVRSRAYMPEDMPLGTSDGKFAFMLHLRRQDFSHVENPNMGLIFHASDTIEELRRKGLHLTPTRSKNRYKMIDSVGIASELVVGR